MQESNEEFDNRERGLHATNVDCTPGMWTACRGCGLNAGDVDCTPRMWTARQECGLLVTPRMWNARQECGLHVRIVDILARNVQLTL